MKRRADIQLYCPTAISLAEMDIHNMDSQLGLGHCVFNTGDYHGAVAPAHFQHEVVIAHAENPAADEVHPGEIQAVQFN